MLICDSGGKTGLIVVYSKNLKELPRKLEELNIDILDRDKTRVVSTPENGILIFYEKNKTLLD